MSASPLVRRLRDRFGDGRTVVSPYVDVAVFAAGERFDAVKLSAPAGAPSTS